MTAWLFLRAHWRTILPVVAILGLSIALMLTRATLAAEKASRALDRAKVEAAAEKSLARVLERHRAIKDQYDRNADNAQASYVAGLGESRDLADRYIVRNRVRTVYQCPSGGNPAPATGDGPGVPEGVPAASELVAVTPSDVQACAAAVNYADRAHEWALTLKDAPQ